MRRHPRLLKNTPPPTIPPNLCKGAARSKGIKNILLANTHEIYGISTEVMKKKNEKGKEAA